MCRYWRILLDTCCRCSTRHLIAVLFYAFMHTPAFAKQLDRPCPVASTAWYCRCLHFSMHCLDYSKHDSVLTAVCNPCLTVCHRGPSLVLMRQSLCAGSGNCSLDLSPRICLCTASQAAVQYVGSRLKEPPQTNWLLNHYWLRKLLYTLNINCYYQLLIHSEVRTFTSYCFS